MERLALEMGTAVGDDRKTVAYRRTFCCSVFAPTPPLAVADKRD